MPRTLEAGHLHTYVETALVASESEALLACLRFVGSCIRNEAELQNVGVASARPTFHFLLHRGYWALSFVMSKSNLKHFGCQVSDDFPLSQTTRIRYGKDHRLPCLISRIRQFIVEDTVYSTISRPERLQWIEDMTPTCGVFV
jgi:hypothetical protein